MERPRVWPRSIRGRRPGAYPTRGPREDVGHALQDVILAEGQRLPLRDAMMQGLPDAVKQ
jgi:hypothetical protein